ncbi:nucleotide disphospho-sugar-binding domain-containing protein [Phytohabitans rumicis]|uniref:Glycosyl transferase n=1 Tax=Phytohabitans rumicis TaxID=1076125 RepID=A0A6V8LMT6_9ACTN|nr:nucleotide disphospho-sugar-binding domain-containing protein [Phytohabitans rumicis]GFJ95407.1 glycosyl transferase [Phytohabitans rumicis]
MRVLFVSTPGIGHVFPMVPLAWALRSAGHDVLVATAGPALAVERAGLAVVDVATGFAADRARRMRERPEVIERLRSLRGQKLRDLRQAIDYLAVLSNVLVDGALDVATAWRPDLLVQSQIDGAGTVVASKLGIPLVTHGFGLARTDGMAELYRDRMAEAFDRHAAADVPQRSATIDVAPPSMLDGPVCGWSMRYVPYNGGGVLPDWSRQPAVDRPRIAVTLGTLEPERGGLDAVQQIIAAAAALDVELVLALGDIDTSTLGALAPHVRVAGWIPINTLLHSCTAIIHHGGAGTTLTALDAGVPQLVLPSGADRHINASAVHDRGVGIHSETGNVDGAQLHRLIHDSALRDTAAEVQAEMRAMPSPASLLPRLTALTE